VNADANGLPGKVLATTDATNLGSFGDCCQLVVGKGGPGLPVTQGTQYWVVVSTDSSTQDTFDAWAFNSTDMREDYAFATYSSSTGVWQASEGLLPGYAVLGQ
jgi:hypothetical protein